LNCEGDELREREREREERMDVSDEREREERMDVSEERSASYTERARDVCYIDMFGSGLLRIAVGRL